MSKEKKIPLRMCIACREMKEKSTLIRIVRDVDNKFCIDKMGKKSGRGAYLCDNIECMKKCVKNRLLNRNFKCEIPCEVYDKLAEEFARDGQN